MAKTLQLMKQVPSLVPWNSHVKKCIILQPNPSSNQVCCWPKVQEGSGNKQNPTCEKSQKKKNPYLGSKMTKYQSLHALVFIRGQKCSMRLSTIKACMHLCSFEDKSVRWDSQLSKLACTCVHSRTKVFDETLN
jgi:hypothetical protein